jgi:predicted aspartyl protease
LSVSVSVDERGLAWFLIRVKGVKGSAVFRAVVDTGATFCLLSDVECVNLGLLRKGRERVTLMTVKGETSLPLFVAPLMKVENTSLVRENVEVVARAVTGFPAILGMSFMRHFDWSFSKEKQEFTIF